MVLYIIKERNGMISEKYEKRQCMISIQKPKLTIDYSRIRKLVLQKLEERKGGTVMRKRIIWFCFTCLLWIGILPLTAWAAEYPYFIEVNLTQNVVTVYRKDAEGAYTIPDRAFVCSVGSDTPTGTFQTSDKYEWRALFGNVYGQYATRITGHILFHSVPYDTMYDKGSLEYEEYNKLGTSASMGCIRLTVEDVKWIYDHCPSGTTVRMVENNDPLPIQPEMPMKLDLQDTEKRGWDPTDPDPENPWNNILPNHARLEDINVKSTAGTFAVEAFYGDGNYYLSAVDAKRIFAQLGRTVSLPASVPDAIRASDTTTIEIQGKTGEAAYCIYWGKSYYKLRDLADFADVRIFWNEKTGDILLTEAKTAEWTDGVILSRNIAPEQRTSSTMA